MAHVAELQAKSDRMAEAARKAEEEQEIMNELIEKELVQEEEPEEEVLLLADAEVPNAHIFGIRSVKGVIPLLYEFGTHKEER